jgi:hypothetical protein
VQGRTVATLGQEARRFSPIVLGATCDRLRDDHALIPPVLSTAPVLGPAFEVEADAMLRRLAGYGYIGP